MNLKNTNIHMPKQQKAALEAKYKKRLRGLYKADIFELCLRKGIYVPGKKARCPMSRDLLIMVVAKTIWCPLES